MNHIVRNLSSNIIACVIFISLLSSCQQNNEVQKENNTLTNNENTPLVSVPSFNEDSTYNHIKKQVSFGPRIPGTKSQLDCIKYLESYFLQYTKNVKIQSDEVGVYTGKKVPCYNLIVEFQPELSNKVIYSAHWDTRPFADNDDEKSKQSNTFEGANDGASGVAILMELARTISTSPLKNKGVTFILWDVEDYGMPNETNSYCLGSQSWAKQIDPSKYQADYLINLDMVGGKGATFPKEGVSVLSASNTVNKLWNTASRLGYSKYFVNKNSNQITDDHAYVYERAKIPAIDIIDMRESGGFTPTWHTTNDNIQNIDKQTLKAVGQTLLQFIYEEDLVK